jgi:hypothetical protein
MRNRFTALALAAVFAAAPAGCSQKDESKPNPDLKVPDVPAGKREVPGGAKDSKGKDTK